MKLKVKSWQVEGETCYDVVYADAPEAEEPTVVFSGNSWAEAELYVAELGGG